MVPEETACCCWVVCERQHVAVWVGGGGRACCCRGEAVYVTASIGLLVAFGSLVLLSVLDIQSKLKVTCVYVDT